MGTRKRHTAPEPGSKQEKRRRRRRGSKRPQPEGLDLKFPRPAADLEVSDIEQSPSANGERKVKRKGNHGGPLRSKPGLRPTLLALLLVLILFISGGVYVYNFVDVPQTIDFIQMRMASMVGYSEFPKDQATDPPKAEVPLPPASKDVEEPPAERKPDSDFPEVREGRTESRSTKESDSKTSADEEKVPPESRDTKKAKKTYPKAGITNAADNKIRVQLDKADDLFDKGEFQESLNAYTVILTRHSQSPRASYGRAQALDQFAEKERSNAILAQSIEGYLKVLDLADVPDDLYMKAGRQAGSRQTFRGWNNKAMQTLKRMSQKFPHNLSLLNELGVKRLMVSQTEEARETFKKVLESDPDNGFALVHLGFILKTKDQDLASAIHHLQRGIDTRAEGTMDGRFVFHLGDAYFRTGQHNKSVEIYKLGADTGLFLSFWQRSLYNVDRLTGRPWWTKQQTGNPKHLQMLEENWEVIRDEGLAQMDAVTGSFLNEEENLRETGDWKQFTLYARGRKDKANCEKAPKTCALLEKFTAATSCSRGQIKFSVMHPGVHVWPHNGPTNCRIRAHLGLVVPDGPRIRVTDKTKTWKEGKILIFDDSFEHEVWHEGDSLRLVLIVDMWHPELTHSEKSTLSPI